MIAILFVCFFLSGAAALVYEVVWMRMLTQIFGSTAYAVATVLAAFMAGLALGSYVFGRLASAKRNLLLLYGILEAGIGVYGFLAPFFFKGARGVYGPLFWLYELSPAAFNLLLFVFSFILLAVPTFLMGATLPVLSQFFVRSVSQLGRRVGDLYATNTLGAVFGCALAGFYLIPQIGLSGTVYTAAIGNLLIAALIILTSGAQKKPAAAAETGAESESRRPRSSIEWLLLAAIALSGAAAMVYENAWTHALTLVIGGSVYSFTTMLVTFLIGLAAGGYLYARLFGARAVGASAFGLIELGVGLAALATIPLFEKLPLVFIRLHESFGDSFSMLLAMRVLLAFAVMFLPTLLLGMTFPLVVCLFTQNVYRVASGVGTTYTANTFGAIIGAFVGGFIFLPLVGMQTSIVIGALLNLAIGLALLVADPRPGRARRLVLGGAVAAALAVAAFRFPFWDQAVLTSGVTVYANRFSSIPTDSLRVEEMRRDRILYYREGLTATVSVHETPHTNYRYFKTNGKVDGSYGDALTMLMTGYVPMLLYPEARQVAVIGLGTGMTVKAVGTFPSVKGIEVLEIEPAIVAAARFFGEKNGNILDDPRVRVVPTDGRNYLMAAPRLYDLIISEPSNPWIAGIASLFTRDFYATARGKLAPGGVFTQWIHDYSMSPDDLRMVFRTLAESFPHVSVWNLQESDFLLIGSAKEQQFDYPRLQSLLAGNETLKNDLHDLGLSDLYAVLGFYRMGRKELVALADGAEFNTDDNARLEFSAPRSLGKSTSDLNRKIIDPFVTEPPWQGDPPWMAPARRHFHLAEALHASAWNDRALAQVDRAVALEPQNADYQLLRAKILVAQENTAEAAKTAAAALALDRSKMKNVLILAEELYTSEAKGIYLKALAADSRQFLPYLRLGETALFRKQITEAESWLRQAEKMQPKQPGLLLALGKLQAAQGNYAEAVKLLEEAKNKGEDSATLYGELGFSYSRLEQWQKATAMLEQALKTQRNNTGWRLLYGEALRNLGRTDEAELKFREVLALEPDNAEAWKKLRELKRKY
jgi:spermidine synthase